MAIISSRFLNTLVFFSTVSFNQSVTVKKMSPVSSSTSEESSDSDSSSSDSSEDAAESKPNSKNSKSDNDILSGLRNAK